MASAPKLHSILLLAQLILMVMVVSVEWKSCGTAALAETDTAIRSRCMEGAASTVPSAQEKAERVSIGNGKTPKEISVSREQRRSARASRIPIYKSLPLSSHLCKWLFLIGMTDRSLVISHKEICIYKKYLLCFLFFFPESLEF